MPTDDPSFALELCRVLACTIGALVCLRGWEQAKSLASETAKAEKIGRRHIMAPSNATEELMGLGVHAALGVAAIMALNSPGGTPSMLAMVSNVAQLTAALFATFRSILSQQTRQSARVVELAAAQRDQALEELEELKKARRPPGGRASSSRDFSS